MITLERQRKNETFKLKLDLLPQVSVSKKLLKKAVKAISPNLKVERLTFSSDSKFRFDAVMNGITIMHITFSRNNQSILGDVDFVLDMGLENIYIMNHVHSGFAEIFSDQNKKVETTKEKFLADLHPTI